MEGEQFLPKITCFHCINAVNDDAEQLLSNDKAIVRFVKLACSSMVKDIYLLRAFEAGADGVVLMVCPDDMCRYIKGSLRARKRVAWLKKLLDDIGLDGNRLFIYNTTADEIEKSRQFFLEVVARIVELGPNPASG